MVLWVWLKKLIFRNMNQRIELFFVWLQELIFCQNNSNNWTFLDKTQRTEILSIWPKEIELLCWMWLKELKLFFVFAIWLKQMNLFWNLTQILELFCWMLLKELDFFFECDSMNFFCEKRLQTLRLF